MEFTLNTEPYSDALAEAYSRLLPEQAAGISAGKLPWRYAKNPSGESVFSLARDEHGRVVAMIAMLATRLRLNDSTIIAYQAMDTIVDPACRGHGLFQRIVRQFHAVGAILPGDLLYGFPNDNVAEGYFTKLGWTRMASLPFLIKPMRAGYFLRKFLGGHARFFDAPLSLAHLTARADAGITTLSRFDASVDALWEQASAGVRCAVERKAEYLNWRIFDHPEQRYTTKAILAADGSLQAFMTYILLHKHGGKIGYVMEALCLPGCERQLQRLLHHANAEFMRGRADAVLAWCLAHAPNYRAYKRAGFVAMPERIRPITLHFGGRWLKAGNAPAGLDARDWYLSYLDSDTV